MKMLSILAAAVVYAALPTQAAFSSECSNIALIDYQKTGSTRSVRTSSGMSWRALCGSLIAF
jgi:hypothetical protein